MRLAAAMSVIALAGCASCPPFRASWYLDERASSAGDKEEGPPPVRTMYLVLLNEGATTVKLSEVVVNPEDHRSSWWQRFFRPLEGRTGHMVVVGKDDKPVGDHATAGTNWKPGELLLLKVVDRNFSEKDTHAVCSVPLSVQIQCDEGCRAVRQVSGALPNYLHDDWLKHCLHPKGNEP